VTSSERNPKLETRKGSVVASVLLGLALMGCQRSDAPTGGVKVATTTSYLECAARDLLSEHFTVLRLAEPGTCPGHFDMRPSQVTELRQCRALRRFDFQK
jgi:zinc transport system substrate-binding protein